jgi:hypothetical protein
MNHSDPAEFLKQGLDPSQQHQLGDLQGVSQALSAWQVPQPTPDEQAAFVNALIRQLPQTSQGHPTTQPHFGPKGWGNLILAQARLFEVEFWYACGIMLLFTLLGGALIGNGGLALFTLMGSPLLAMAGVLYVYHHESSSLSALETVSPVGRYALFYCRSALILGMSLVALPLLLLPGQLLFPQLVFWRVVLIWLGALVGLFGLATYATVRWNGLIGTVLPLGIWGLLVITSWQQAFVNAGNWLMAPLWLTQIISASNGVLVGALLGLVGGAWLLFQTGRWVKKADGVWA